MVSWSRAFRGAAGIVLYSIIWWIIGSLLIGAGFFISGWGFSTGFYGSGAALISMLGGVILIFIGSVIGILGTMAAFLKILPEIVVEEIKNS
ncbi:MAG: hypothetical protein HXS47_01805 [Theionarchaea archaeon]|nr:hypothetical protein [Theionarchaea archaeon]